MKLYWKWTTKYEFHNDEIWNYDFEPTQMLFTIDEIFWYRLLVYYYQEALRKLVSFFNV